MNRLIISNPRNIKCLLEKANSIPKSIPARSFSSFNIFGNKGSIASKYKSESMKRIYEESPTEDNLVNYLKALNIEKPALAADYIQKGWSTGKVPINEVTLKEYIKAAAALNKIDQMDFIRLFSLLKDKNVLDSSANIQFMQPLASGSFMGSAGSSYSNPIYVSSANDSSFRDSLFKIARSVIGLFLLFSLVGSFLDDYVSKMGSQLPMGNSKVNEVKKPDKSFKDVVGVDEAKSELEEIVQFLKNPSKFTQLGGSIPKGVLLAGPPGTGKTLLAKAIAGEADVPFLYASGSEFEEVFVGVGSKRIRELFTTAREKKPCIIFIDEIDALGGSRKSWAGSYTRSSLNQLLVEMDGFKTESGVIVIAATNFPQSLDAALMRPGRFDKVVNVPLPDITGRKAILELYGQKMKLSKDIDFDQIARATPGFSGADLFNLLNQAALKASSSGLTEIGLGEVEFAKDKILMGPERKSSAMSPESLKLTAYHEAGHALVAYKTQGSHPIYKATIIPRGNALGYVSQLPEGDQVSISRKQLLAELDICMGGRIAEELIFGEDNVTSGASSDIANATRIARQMVTKFGLSSKVGMMSFDFSNESKPPSETTQTEIDSEVKKLLDDSYIRSKQLIESNLNELELIAKGLLKYETLSGSEIAEILSKKSIESINRSHKPSLLINKPLSSDEKKPNGSIVDVLTNNKEPSTKNQSFFSSFFSSKEASQSKPNIEEDLKEPTLNGKSKSESENMIKHDSSLPSKISVEKISNPPDVPKQTISSNANSRESKDSTHSSLTSVAPPPNDLSPPPTSKAKDQKPESEESEKSSSERKGKPRGPPSWF